MILLLHTTFCPRGSKSNIQRPLLPTNLLFPLRKPSLSPLLLEKLNCHGAPHSCVPRPHIRTGVQLPDQRRSPLVDQSLELNILHEWQGQIQNIPRGWPQGREESMKEYRVENTYGLRLSAWHCSLPSVPPRERIKGKSHLPRTTSLTDDGSANTSIIYSGGLRWSIVLGFRVVESWW